MQIICKACERVIKYKPEHAGRSGNCPQCNGVVMLPAAAITEDEDDEEYEDEDAAKFIGTCNLFIRLVRLIGWIIGGLASFRFLFTGAADGMSAAILIAVFVTLLATYLVIEFQVLFLRFMRETIRLLACG